MPGDRSQATGGARRQVGAWGGDWEGKGWGKRRGGMGGSEGSDEAEGWRRGWYREAEGKGCVRLCPSSNVTLSNFVLIIC